MSKNKILEYLEDIIYFKRNSDSEGMEALRREGRAESVTLEDVGFALIDIIDDLARHVDTSQALTEVRLRAIVDCMDNAEEVHKAFAQAEDDLFLIDESEENENGTEENNASS